MSFTIRWLQVSYLTAVSKRLSCGSLQNTYCNGSLRYDTPATHLGKEVSVQLTLVDEVRVLFPLYDSRQDVFVYDVYALIWQVSRRKVAFDVFAGGLDVLAASPISGLHEPLADLWSSKHSEKAARRIILFFPILTQEVVDGVHDVHFRLRTDYVRRNFPAGAVPQDRDVRLGEAIAVQDDDRVEDVQALVDKVLPIRTFIVPAPGTSYQMNGRSLAST